MKKKQHWYVEPTGSDDVKKHTNEVIAAYLASRGKSPNGAYSALSDQDGALHQVWEMTEDEIVCLKKEIQRGEPIKFNIFSRSDDEVVIYPQHPTRSIDGQQVTKMPRRGRAFHKAQRDLRAVLKARNHAARKAALTDISGSNP